MSLLLYLALTCPPPLLTDYSGDGWTDPWGRDTIPRATYVCNTRYKSCLLRLERRNGNAFKALCGLPPR